LIDLTGTR